MNDTTRSEAMIKQGIPSHKTLTKHNKNLTRNNTRLSKKVCSQAKKVETLEAKLVRRQETYDRKIISLKAKVEDKQSYIQHLYGEIRDLEQKANRKGDNRQFLLDLSGVPQLPSQGLSLSDTMSVVRSELIDQALTLAKGNQTLAGKLLGITPQSIHAYVKESKEAA